MTDPVSDLVRDIAAGTGIGDSVYADPGSYEELHRTPLPGGELVTFTLIWEEDGVPHAAHQAHVLGIEGDRVVRHEVWCGGRWSAELQTEMADA